MPETNIKAETPRRILNEKASKLFGYSHVDDFCNSWSLCGAIIEQKEISVHKNNNDEKWVATNGDILEVDQNLADDDTLVCIASEPKIAILEIFIALGELENG